MAAAFAAPPAPEAARALEPEPTADAVPDAPPAYEASPALEEPPEVAAAFAEPPTLPPEPTTPEPIPRGGRAPPTPSTALSDVEEAFFSSPPGQAPEGPPPLPPVEQAATDQAPAEISIALELTGERPLAGPEPTEAPSPPALAPQAPAPPAPPPPAGLPPGHELTLEKPLRPPPPAAPVDPAALVGAYLVSPRGSDDRAFLLGKLVERAAEVAPILCEQLPGPLDVPAEALASTPAPGQGPVLAAVAALGPAAAGPLAAMLADPAAARRRAAVALLGQLGEPAAFLPLTERCFDPDPAVAEAARAALALHRRDPAMKPVPEKLRRALLSGLADKAAAAARAIAALRDAESIPLLIQALEGSDAGTAAASAEALAAITLQRHGVKARDWLMWWKQNRGRQRTEWLFGALTAGDRELRLQAATELREAAASPVSYSADLPEAERAAAAQAWRSWFQQGGHRL